MGLRRKEFGRGDGKKAHKATLCARIYFDVNFGEGAATTSIQVDLLLLFAHHCANSHTLACAHKRERNYNMAKLISCTLSLAKLAFHKSLFFFIQIYNIYARVLLLYIEFLRTFLFAS
jgi:hypothetical protein